MMDLIKFYRMIARRMCNVEEIAELFGDSKIDLNRNCTYACGATWILPLPLVVALQYRNYEVARFLMEKGASLDAFCHKTQMRPRDLVTEAFLADPARPCDRRRARRAGRGR